MPGYLLGSGHTKIQMSSVHVLKKSECSDGGQEKS